ncbi:hypothetical protein COEREDRAFT_100758 [Coemansia reversa NRRL 1564]|uniref:P-loop containing nucleoside triphosphate hydrolase protein n=1 Tax=Coemansia reversa (strain ATCC 12441 / NRRL 1564) TaxID=763665 RepID=A0A2G5BHM9_COERN|nr:hypothetical protein COEREDRAFT_100758 [Coemansia reversa NRRL 1564]|eukprot:PIA18528.1 hypothetical protein COEREDRAFT_100758 [Coemansia reversa NRRL 1564]
MVTQVADERQGLLAREESPQVESCNTSIQTVLGSSVVKVAVLAAAGAAAYDAASSITQFRHGPMHQRLCATGGAAGTLENECFRLGIMWPAVNLALTAAVLINLIRGPWKRHVAGGSSARANVDTTVFAFHDNRRSVARALAVVVVGAAAIALIFVQVTGKDEQRQAQRVYWQSCVAFWAAVAMAVTRNAMLRSGSGRFQGSLMTVLCVHALMCGLGESYFTFGFPSHAVRPEQIPLVRSPEDAHSVLGILLFNWVTPVLSLDRPLSAWRRYVAARVPGRSLLRTLGMTFVWQLLRQGALAVLGAVLSFAQPFFLQRILLAVRLYSAAGGGSRLEICFDAVGLLLTSVLHSMVINQVLWAGRRVSIQLQCLLVAELSSRALLRRSKNTGSEKKASTEAKAGDKSDSDGEKNDATAGSDGRVANMLTSDMESLGHIASYLDHIYTLPVEFVVGTWYLYNLLGMSALIGLLLTAAYYPLTRLMMRFLVRFQRRLFALDDERVTMVTEVFQGIRAVKLFGWQSRFIERVRAKREEEIRMWWKLALLQLPVWFVRSLTTSVILVVILAIHALVFGHALTADVVFPTVTVFSMVSRTLNSIPGIFRWFSGCYVSLTRVENFMVQSQLQPLEQRIDTNEPMVPGEVGFVDASFVWAADPQPATVTPEPTPTFELRDITLRFPAGELSIIVGPTAAGKSSLLSALIGEMTLTDGRIILPTMDFCAASAAAGENQGAVMENVAYVAQEAWLRNATIRDNITFGAPYDEARYEEVLRVCALKPDLRILAAGDRTEIGERGITLSGGQKQRMALARAVYSDRRILLIDDCLSAVDAHTARHILMECLVGQTPLMQGRTRVLVTHHVAACLPHCRYIAVLKDGRVAMSGSPQQLQDAGHSLSKLGGDVEVSYEDSSEVDASGPKVSDVETLKAASHQPKLSSAMTGVNDLKTEDTYNAERRAALGLAEGADDGLLVEDEEREQGYVPPAVWLGYMRMCGGWAFWTLALVLLLASRGTRILQDYWVRMWMVDAEQPTRSVVFWLVGYVLFGVGSTAMGIVQSLNETTGGMRAARRYHEQLFARVMNATPRFFDKTPIGRVISRFARDMRTVDDSILRLITMLGSQLMQVVSVFVIITSVTPPFAVIAVGMAVAYTMLAIYYLNATRELKRLDSISMSPLLSLFSELVTGVETIRAFGAQSQYTMEAMNRVDAHNRPFYMMWAANRWLCTRIEFSGCIVSFSATVLIVLSLDRIDAGLAGFVLMYAVSFSDCMLWFIRNYSECEINMNSVERINQYLVLDQEAAAFSPADARPPNAWPRSGTVSVCDLVVEYVPDTPVLRGLSFTVAHGEKIGVVGRTGAGKSTLSLAFMRFVEASSGHILVDDVDIAAIGLEELRRNITIIPQDPVLFNGTIRFNLDPFEEYPDELLLDALRRSYLIQDDRSAEQSPTTTVYGEAAMRDGSDDEAESLGTASALEDTATSIGKSQMSAAFTSLEAEIKENGQNLSLGQRQLVALARALVRRSRLIIMDEATAAVDFETDESIQRTIRGPEFADSTLFCIAHRLRTVIDYDRLLVLDKGMVVEFDTPWNLLQIPNGHFRAMCENSGELSYLLQTAKTGRSSQVE